MAACAAFAAKEGTTVSYKYDYAIHPLAKLFPSLPPDEFRKLKDDIQKNGQIVPIWMGKDYFVLDGRHRLRACKELGIEPILRRLSDISNVSEEDFIWSSNVLRRHLTDGQRAAIAVHWSDEVKKAAKDRRLANLKRGSQKPEGAKTTPSGKSRMVIAKQANVSEHSVRQAESVAKHKPELLPKIESGQVSLKDAQKQVAAELTSTTRDVPALRASSEITVNLLSSAREMILSAADAVEELSSNRSQYPRGSRSWELFDTAVKRLQDALQTLETSALVRSEK
jgi:ParB-like chromosome segregation protein Spo0J